ncbi:hypothetical protein NQ176_g9456 [Zarea fungicola]|uniref:Uncharacterized protein n=1 Tax=Zarea fungicola TaxID=93591 RepID=A0ACC1MM17_9HYPO|nr:hypothetical protein NQ176_g9456 [Lecanicillium fungicola]
MSRRWTVYGPKLTRITDEHELANRISNKTKKKNRRPCDVTRDPIFERATSTSSDANYIEACVEEELVDLTFVYEKRDIEMLSDDALRRLPTAVRRNMIQYPQTDPNISPEWVPATAPPPRIPHPADDAPQWGYRDKYLMRVKKRPAPERGATEKKMNNSKKRKAPVYPIQEGEKRTKARTRCSTPSKGEQIHKTAHASVALPVGYRITSPCKAISGEVAQSIEVDEIDQRVLLLQQPLRPHVSAKPVPSPGPKTNAPEPCIPDPGPPNIKEVGFRGLPDLVRRQIYRHLLLSPERIYVHAS